MALSDKSHRRKLFACENSGCKVVMFIGNYCPKCGEVGSLLREPPSMGSVIARRDEIRRERDEAARRVAAEDPAAL